MKREVKFSLVFRDMWQSAGKYVPRVDQLVKVAPAIVDMGCFARVETNGGGFEQVNLLFGENPPLSKAYLIISVATPKSSTLPKLCHKPKEIRGKSNPLFPQY